MMAPSSRLSRLLVLVAVLLLFLLLPVVVASGVVAVVVGGEHVAVPIVLDGCIKRFALGSFTLALAATVLPGVKNLIEPREHLLDRGQLARRSRLAAGTLGTLRPLWTGGPLWSRLALRTGIAWFALRARFSRWTGFAHRSGFSDGAWLAARAIWAAPSRMSLRSRPSGFALPSARTRRPLSSLPALIVCHVTAPAEDHLFLAAFHDSSNCAAPRAPA